MLDSSWLDCDLLTPQGIPQQKNDSDCGVFVLEVRHYFFPSSCPLFINHFFYFCSSSSAPVCQLFFFNLSCPMQKIKESKAVSPMSFLSQSHIWSLLRSPRGRKTLERSFCHCPHLIWQPSCGCGLFSLTACLSVLVC